MLKVTVENHRQPCTLKLEGRLTGAWVDEAARRWDDYSKNPAEGPLVVDLGEVTFLDERGKELLARMLRSGAELTKARLLTKLMVEEIQAELQTT